MDVPVIVARHAAVPPPLIAAFDHAAWREAQRLSLRRNWRGEPAPAALHTTALTLWTDDELWFGFACGYTELDIDAEFDVNEERYQLWELDVCEAFVRSPLEPDERVYKEFEVAPTGQWCDLKVDRRDLSHDWLWQSGMRTAHAIDDTEKIWRVVMAIPFAAFGPRPQRGDEWRANLFRVSRHHGERQYLALAPTCTDLPNYHVPERFVPLRFD